MSNRPGSALAPKRWARASESTPANSSALPAPTLITSDIAPLSRHTDRDYRLALKRRASLAPAPWEILGVP